MVPREDLELRIFQLAREELKSIPQTHPVAASVINETCGKDGKDEFASLFFDWYPNWGGVSRVSDGTEDGIMSVAKMWKCANNQLDGFWRQVIEQVPPESSNKVIDSVRRKRVPFHLRLNDIDKHGGKECIVAAIRDPISHFLSGYNEMEYRVKLFHRDPLSRTWPFGAFAIGTEERFQQFLIDILSCPMEHHYSGIVGGYPRLLEIQHLFSMSSVLKKLASEQQIYNVTREFHYLPTLKNLTANWGAFMVESCPNSFSSTIKQRILSTPMATKLGQHESTKDPTGAYTASMDVWKAGGAFGRSLCAIHMMDYACWQDLPDGVPTICMDLFQTYYEKQLL